MKPSSRHPCSPGGRCPAHSALPAIRPPRCHLPSTWRLSLPPLGRCKARVGQEPAGDPTDENAPESVFLSVQCGLDRHGRRQSFAVQVFRYTRAEKYKPFPKAKVVLLSFAVLGGEVERGSLHKRMWDCSFTFLSFLGSWCILFPTPGLVLGMICPLTPLLCLVSGPRAFPGEPSKTPRLLFVPTGLSGVNPSAFGSGIRGEGLITSHPPRREGACRSGPQGTRGARCLIMFPVC